jgi:VWFA-related protein
MRRQNSLKRPVCRLLLPMLLLTMSGLWAQQTPTPAPVGREPGTPLFRARVDEVQLHVSVFDEKHRLVTNLRREAFTVTENGRRQALVSFLSEEVPVSLAVVIDNSASMAGVRAELNKAALNLVKASNPQDEVFVVNFTDKAYLDQDFTADLSLLREALDRVASRGATALYDAIVASGEHLMKAGERPRKAIVVLTDGEDNASLTSLEETIRRLSVEGGPAIYAVGLPGEGRTRAARKALQELARQTGGEAFFPQSLYDVDGVMWTVAHDLRNQYILGYKPATPAAETGYRSVHVEVSAPGRKHLVARTREGYYPRPVPPPENPPDAGQKQ